MGKLYAFGCSLTFGHGLRDCWDYKNKHVGNEPSKYAWPQLLANKLGRRCVNLSMPGASNKEICYLLSNHIDKITTDDIVYIKWSYASRWGVIRPSGRMAHIKQDSKLYKRWIRDFYTDEDGMWLTATFIDYAELLLEKNNIKHFFLTADAHYPRALNCKYAKFVKKGSINFYRGKYPKALDNAHPGELAHFYYSEHVYNRTKDVI